MCFRGASSDFVPETGDPKIEGFHGFSQSRDASFIVLSNSVFITILGFKGINIPVENRNLRILNVLCHVFIHLKYPHIFMRKKR